MHSEVPSERGLVQGRNLGRRSNELNTRMRFVNYCCSGVTAGTPVIRSRGTGSCVALGLRTCAHAERSCTGGRVRSRGRALGAPARTSRSQTGAHTRPQSGWGQLALALIEVHVDGEKLGRDSQHRFRSLSARKLESYSRSLGSISIRNSTNCRMRRSPRRLRVTEEVRCATIGPGKAWAGF